MLILLTATPMLLGPHSTAAPGAPEQLNNLKQQNQRHFASSAVGKL